MLILLQIIILPYLVAGKVSNDEANPCGDWAAFEDEKCFQFFSHEKHGEPLDFGAAAGFCAGQDARSSLASISSKEEFKFVKEYLYVENKVDDLVWIGGRFTNNGFSWPDGSPLEFTNWSEGSPKNQSDYCILLESELYEKGKWTDVPCSRRNYVLCQKPQRWPLPQLQSTVLKIRKLLKQTAAQLSDTQNKLDFTARKLKSKSRSLKTTSNHLKEASTDLKSMKIDLENLKEGYLPPGFLYMQLFGQKAPSDLWPHFEWRDISENYAGQFFRVLGGNSSSWGTRQSGSAPRITHVEILPNQGKSDSSIIIPYEGWSEAIYSATAPSNGGLSFYTRNDEVHPANEPVKLWARI